ncbi:MAG: CAP domain-containing protein [Bradymonadaceae bacterium]
MPDRRRLAAISASVVLPLVAADLAAETEPDEGPASGEVQAEDDAPQFPDAHFQAQFGEPEEYFDETGNKAPSVEDEAVDGPKGSGVVGSEQAFDELDRTLEQQSGESTDSNGTGESTGGESPSSSDDDRGAPQRRETTGSADDDQQPQTNEPEDPADDRTAREVEASNSQRGEPGSGDGEAKGSRTKERPLRGESPPQHKSPPNKQSGSSSANRTSSVRQCGRQPHDRLLRLLNQTRREHGLDPLPCDPHLNRSAEAHARDMCQGKFLAHRGSDGSRPADRIADAYGSDPVRGGGENVAAGHPNARLVHRGWMHSPGHRENILRESFDAVGFGYAECNGRPRWVQNFAILP